MKQISLLLLSTALSLGITELSAQDTPRTPVVRKGTKTQGKATKQTPQPSTGQLSERAKTFGTTDRDPYEHASWLRSIYRSIDLTRRANAPLYSPQVATESEGNLFAQIFQLYAAGKLPVYEYIDGTEQLDEAHRLSFKDFLGRFHIDYTEGRPSDIPSSDVKSYYLKEVHLFDEGTSTYTTEVTALCPILSGIGDYGELRMPLFWVKYSDLQPYLRTQLIALSAQNGIRRSTLDDFFRLGLYEGEIIKADDLLGRTLVEEYPTPEAQKEAQKQIERELSDFRSQLYLPNSIRQSGTPTSKKKKAKLKKLGSSSAQSQRLPSKATKPTSTSSSRSVRDRGQD